MKLLKKSNSELKFDAHPSVYNWMHPQPDPAKQLPRNANPFHLMARETGTRRRALYIHIPFCDTICTFCPFIRAGYRNEQEVEAYVNALVREIEIKGAYPGVSKHPFVAVYIGGGTPSILSPEQIRRLGKALRRNFDLRHVQEFSVEFEAKSATADRVHACREIGVNRSSFCVQTFSPKYREIFNLTASLDDVHRAVADLEAAELGKQQVAVDTSQGKALVEPTPQLNQASEPEARREHRVPLSAFLSYSHEDKKAKAIFQQNLTVMMKKKLITPWHDGLIEPDTLWCEDIEKHLTDMDVFVGLLTTAFLASDFIEKVELRAAREKLHAQGKDFVFVLVLVDDISLTGLDLAQYEIIKPGGKAVCKHPRRKDGFNEAQKELEQLILLHQKEKKGTMREEAAFLRPTRRAQEQEGITIINVRGDYIKGGKSMSDDHSISIGGDSYGQVGQTLTNCTNMVQQQAPGERKDLLEALYHDVKKLIECVPADKKDEVAENLEMLLKQATSDRPNRKWYSISAEGLLEASKWVRDFTGNIGGTSLNLGKALWPDFKLPGSN